MSKAIPLVEALEQSFRSAADPERAMGMAAYMKHRFVFLGIPKPQRAALQKEAFRGNLPGNEAGLIEVLITLWAKPEREFHYAACELARACPKLQTPDIFETFEALIRSNQWWDSVDTLSPCLVGPLIQKYPALLPQMDRWIGDSDFWVRRGALLFQLKYKGQTEADRLFRYCEAVMHEKEFFIRKAIGWALREYSKTDAAAVRGFLTKNRDLLSPLSFREAGKYV